MATTTNYAWETPDDTDLVKDGAAAIRTLGSSIDTTTKALNPSTTLGDIEYRSATANTNTRLGIGTTGQVLTVASGVPSWATPANGGGMTLLSTTSLSGTSTTISSISGDYNNLIIVIRNLKASTGDSVFFRFNGITAASNYYGFYTTGGNGTTGGAFKTSAPASLAWASSGKIIIENALNGTYPSSFEIIAQDYAKTTEPKSFSIQGANSNTGDNYVGNAQLIATTAVISSFTIGSNGGSATLSGSVLIYGVN